LEDLMAPIPPLPVSELFDVEDLAEKVTPERPDQQIRDCELHASARIERIAVRKVKVRTGVTPR
jgi:hypothetical protein